MAKGSGGGGRGGGGGGGFSSDHRGLFLGDPNGPKFVRIRTLGGGGFKVHMATNRANDYLWGTPKITELGTFNSLGQAKRVALNAYKS